MPKDRRAEKRAKERDKDEKRRQISLEDEAEVLSGDADTTEIPDVKKKKAHAAGQNGNRKKKKKPRARTIVWIVLTVLVVAFLVFLFVAGNFVYKSFFQEEADKTDAQLTSYVMTPTANQDKVSYYLVGVMGGSELDSSSALSVLCHDKSKSTLTIMQIPVKLYIGGQDQWIVPTIGQVWGSPKPMDWCETCRKRVYAPEIITAEDGSRTHSVCGTAITQKAGSSYISLIDAVNSQLGLPVDHYFILPQQGLITLVNSMGGINITLSEPINLGGQSLDSGNQVLNGQQAMEYACVWWDDNDSDIVRMQRQRQVLTAILQRMFAADPTVVLEDMICEVMDSSTPARTDCSNTLMGDIVTGAFNAKSGSNQPGLKKISFSNMTAFIVPGEAADADGLNVFSPHKNELITLVNASFNPFGTPLSETDLKTAEIANSGAAEQYIQSLSSCVTDQIGNIVGGEG